MQMAFERFEGPLRNTLTRPTGSKLNDFIDDVRTRQQGWYEQYAYYGKSKLQQTGYYDRHGPKDPINYSKPRYAESRQDTNKARFKANDKYRPITGSARKVLPVPDPSKVYHLRHNDSDGEDIQDDDSRPEPDDAVGAYWVDNQAHVCNDKGDIWTSKAAEWGDTLSKAVKK